MIFVEVELGDSVVSYPYIYPGFQASPIDFSFASSEITLSGNPFGNSPSGALNNSYLWSFEIFDSNGGIVYTSPMVGGDQKELSVPSGTLISGEAYTARCLARSQERLLGQSEFIVQSEKKSL